MPSDTDAGLERLIHHFVEDFFASPLDKRFWWVPIVFFGLGEPVLNKCGKVRTWRIERKVPKDARGWQPPASTARHRYPAAL